ncbi:uncharacterized protein PHALS_01850 [Plasmopara halstedii]|uniref:Uncharacterized protein n=1 Tax=Plasmopara halstedii TaxID=4781 RepID=A0A0N7L6Y4_PLAHL|nr:uncharacterized protein PHALS_01850 [Plasmopara halstedii]CEG45563.1 hypothetical protein PHALS_01850 [Plasmopara halstedii]|eukprot:XP_024581932.1 hypothetical protein PHALS_01850 [Plasmopara halstedii]
MTGGWRQPSLKWVTLNARPYFWKFSNLAKLTSASCVWSLSGLESYCRPISLRYSGTGDDRGIFSSSIEHMAL